MSIDWAQAPWADELLALQAPIFCPTGEAMKIERDRDFARQLCHDFQIAFPNAHVARNRLEAEAILERHRQPFVLKNPFCSPTSPIHTILCETLEDTYSWLKHVDYAEGVFMQEYLGRCEAGHIGLVSAGEIYSVVTNQEYKRAFAGNLGIVAGAPLGGLVEKDPGDKYGLARELLHPLRPWLREVNYHGPIQVTAVRREGRWHVIEYNIRIGVTSGAMLLRMLSDPLEVLLRTAKNQPIELKFVEALDFGWLSRLPVMAIPMCRSVARSYRWRSPLQLIVIFGGTRSIATATEPCAAPATGSLTWWLLAKHWRRQSPRPIPISASCAASAVIIDPMWARASGHPETPDLFNSFETFAFFRG